MTITQCQQCMLYALYDAMQEYAFLLIALEYENIAHGYNLKCYNIAWHYNLWTTAVMGLRRLSYIFP